MYYWSKLVYGVIFRELSEEIIYDILVNRRTIKHFILTEDQIIDSYHLTDL